MTDQTIAKMTRDELVELIERMVWDKFGDNAFELDLQPQLDERDTEEVLASIDRNMWTPPQGGKTSLEFLREDRDR